MKADGTRLEARIDAAEDENPNEWVNNAPPQLST